MKFTKEEISLCKQVAKKYRKKIVYGDWYYTTEYPEEKYRARLYKYRWTGMADRTIDKRKDIVPLWTISDCLEFIDASNFYLTQIKAFGDEWVVFICRNNTGDINELRGKTPLKTCLKAVLAVLEEK